MSYRCLMIVNPARIRCKNEQLLIETEEVHSVPIEDISAIVLESRQSTITTAAMAALAQNGVVTFWCDETHLPCGISLPFAQHSRQLGVLRWQMGLTLPAKKRMWQQVVTAKIQNQAECLALCGKTQEAAFLFGRAKAVTSGDKDNVEASAAAYYFPALFGEGYTRRNEDTRNAALNYAYAILRGYMARCLTVYGFQPCLGLHHDSELNQFNLADDLMAVPARSGFVRGSKCGRGCSIDTHTEGKACKPVECGYSFRRAAPQRCLCNGTPGARSAWTSPAVTQIA